MHDARPNLAEPPWHDAAVAYLVVREPGRVGFTAPLNEACCIGRGAGNDIVLHDKLVSRTHVTIVAEDRGHTARDLESRHGMLVNGARSTVHQLGDGDHLQLGNVVLTYRVGSDDGDALIDTTASPLLTPGAGALPDRRERTRQGSSAP